MEDMKLFSQKKGEVAEPTIGLRDWNICIPEG
jgi:hypothetical protein